MNLEKDITKIPLWVIFVAYLLLLIVLLSVTYFFIPEEQTKFISLVGGVQGNRF